MDEAFTRLARVGLETVSGFVLMKNFDAKINTTEQVPVTAANEILSSAFGGGVLAAAATGGKAGLVPKR